MGALITAWFKKKKQKKAKDASGEREAISEIGGTIYMPTESKEVTPVPTVRSQSPKTSKSAEENPEPAESKPASKQ